MDWNNAEELNKEYDEKRCGNCEYMERDNKDNLGNDEHIRLEKMLRLYDHFEARSYKDPKWKPSRRSKRHYVQNCSLYLREQPSYCSKARPAQLFVGDDIIACPKFVEAEWIEKMRQRNKELCRV